MYEPQPSKMEQMRQTFVRLIRHKNEIEECVLKLMKHPDTTAAQIAEVRRAMLALEESLNRVIPTLRKQYPYPTISMVTRPWHKREFDRYDQAIMDTPRAHDSASGETETTLEEGKTNGI